MKENDKVDINEVLDNADPLLTAVDTDGDSLLWDLVLESVSEVVEDRIMNGNDEYNDEAFTQIELGRRYVVEDISSLASLMEHFGKSGQSVVGWADTTEERARPRKRGERCTVCSNMTKKELKKYDSCPSCGRSLFALKSRGW